MKKCTFITKQYYSNCLVEAIKAKLKNKSVKIFFCKPQTINSFQLCHFMWTDGKADYDFSDKGIEDLPWYRSFWFKGAIRKFDLGFASRYSMQRNRKKG